MKGLLMCLVLINYITILYSQSPSQCSYQSHTETSATGRPVLDFTAIDRWPGMGSASSKEVVISDNGKYFTYEIMNQPVNSSTLFVQSTDNSWSLQFPNATPGIFTDDNNHYIFNISDSLCFLPLNGKKSLFVNDVVSWKQPGGNTSQWLAYLLKTGSTLVLRDLTTGNEQRFDSVNYYSFDNTGHWLSLQLINGSNELVLYNLLNNTRQHYHAVSNYSFNSNGSVLLLQTKETRGDAVKVHLQWLQLSSGNIEEIYSGDNATIVGCAMDDSGKQLTFAVQEKNDTHTSSIWYYKEGMNKAVKKVDVRSPGIHAGLKIHGTPGFTDNGKYISISLQEEHSQRKLIPDAAKVDVWSYRDTILQATQLSHLSREPRSFYAVISTDGNQVIQLSSDHEKLKNLSGDYAVIQRDVTGDRFWEKGYQKDSIWLISLKDGSRKFFNTKAWFFSFSPGGKYLIYFDEEKKSNYFSYELATGKLTNITSSVPVHLGDENQYYRPGISSTNYRTGLAAWIEGDEGVLIYDNYDIWLIDLAGKKKPVNVTNEYGRLHSTKLRLTRQNNSNILKPEANLLITAFNIQTKYNGFFRKKLKEKGDPELLSMGPFAIDQNGIGFLPLNSNDFSSGMPPVKAKRSDVWIVKRESTTEAPNFYLTKDFKTYKALTDLHPNKKYNWMTSELISFRQLDGTVSQGVLYRPEDFDSTKKYPLLFNYYEQLSHRLFQFPVPGYTESGFINIPWFVSHGYLVFTPDIYFTPGKGSMSAFNTVVGAAQYLSGLAFVDGQRMGITGHSMSGGFTNYILTHTPIFAAVFEGAGASDIISSTLQLTGEPTDNVSRLYPWVEEGRGSIWQNPDLWLEQSSILKADKVASPLLIFHCKNDWGVPWEQAVELFIALRRLGKKAWMLQYDEGDHLLNNKNDRKDLTIRVTQFFDHYLKGDPPPKWMTQGLPAEFKGFECRYELDLEGSCGDNCTVCKKRNYSMRK